MRPVTDGVVTLRAPEPHDVVALIAGHDDTARRWLGRGSPEPRPSACIVVAGEIVGWVDYDVEQEWLLPGEVNVGYSIFAAFRGRGYATRGVQLLLHRLALAREFHTATLMIHRDNVRSLALPARVDFVPRGEVGESYYFKRRLPLFPYTDGAVTLRPFSVDDIDLDLEAKDDEQIDWLWEPGEREQWEAMSPDEQRAHAVRGLQERGEAFGAGPKWTFATDSRDARYVAYVDCDLANNHVPHGEANISYSSHPAQRGKRYASRAVRVVMRFVRENTGAREAHILVDSENAASLRVARAVHAPEAERFVNERGRTMIRHVIHLRG